MVWCALLNRHCLDGPKVGGEVGVGEVVIGDPAIAVDAPKEDYRVRSTDYGARPKAARGQGELEFGWLG